MSSLNYFNRFISSLLEPKYDDSGIINKDIRIKQHIAYTLNRTLSMFKWQNLPESIPQRNLELILQGNGNACICDYNGTLYAFSGGFGGEPNVYYEPTLYTIANPALSFSKTCKIGKDCALIRNDSLYIGLLPLFYRYASAITETEVSIQIAAINSRIIDLVSAPDDRTRESAQKFFDDVRNGKIGVIAENAFLDGIRAQPYGTTGNRIITDLIELNQYQKASLYNEIGLNSNYNMKRESINSNESQLNDDMLTPFIDDMLRERKEGAERVNAMYGTTISVEFNSAWEENEIETELNLDELSERSENRDSEK